MNNPAIHLRRRIASGIRAAAAPGVLGSAGQMSIHGGDLGFQEMAILQVLDDPDAPGTPWQDSNDYYRCSLIAWNQVVGSEPEVRVDLDDEPESLDFVVGTWISMVFGSPDTDDDGARLYQGARVPVTPLNGRGSRLITTLSVGVTDAVVPSGGAEFSGVVAASTDGLKGTAEGNYLATATIFFTGSDTAYTTGTSPVPVLVDPTDQANVATAFATTYSDLGGRIPVVIGIEATFYLNNMLTSFNQFGFTLYYPTTTLAIQGALQMAFPFELAANDDITVKAKLSTNGTVDIGGGYLTLAYLTPPA